MADSNKYDPSGGFLELLKNLADNVTKMKNIEYSGFLAKIGEKYRHDLMIVGRAVNGWGEGIRPNSLGDENERVKIHDQIVNGNLYSETGKIRRCPMIWVTESAGSRPDPKKPGKKAYNTNRSAFWRTVRNVVDRLKIADINLNSWPSYIAWTNLYKISPHSGGNPNGRLCNLQLDDCKQILKAEIETNKPKRILFLTGLNWAENFLLYLNAISAKNKSYVYVDDYGHIKLESADYSSQYVVALHPQGKKESILVDEVINEYDNLA